MCTVSWRQDSAGYELFFNRDELRSRQTALPPRRIERDGLEVLSPVDADAGGSWLTVNTHGVTIALLNRYGIKTPASRFTSVRSRGQLVLDLSSAKSQSDALERLYALELTDYRPFTLLVLEIDREPVMTASDGHQLEVPSKPVAPLVSSSHDTAAATQARIDLWRRTVDLQDSSTLAAFHRSHWPERGAASPCMHRQDARTVSSTHLTVTADTISMAYADGPPCTTAYGAPLVLERRPAADAA